MKITVSIDDIPKEKILFHPHHFVAGKSCLVFDKSFFESNLYAKQEIIENVKNVVSLFLSSWGY